MHLKLTKFFERRSKLTVVFIAIALSILLGVLDFATRIEMHFLLLNLIPIFLGSWFISRDVGVTLAIFGSLVWFVSDSLNGRAYSSPWIAYWNLLMRSGVFVIFAFTQASLKSKLDELSNLASRDFITGLPNGRAFYQLAAEEMGRASGLEPMTLACIDVSGIQLVNERQGYPAGDQMMCTIAHTIRENVARPDLVGRLAGTTFAVLLPKTASSGANLVARTAAQRAQERTAQTLPPAQLLYQRRRLHQSPAHRRRTHAGSRQPDDSDEKCQERFYPDRDLRRSLFIELNDNDDDWLNDSSFALIG